MSMFIKKYENVTFKISSIIVLLYTIRILIKLFSKGAVFSESIDLWYLCLSALTMYSIFIVLFISISRKFQLLTASFSVISGFFIVFFIAQINLLFVHIFEIALNETILLWGCVIFLAVFLFFKKSLPFEQIDYKKIFCLDNMIVFLCGLMMFVIFLSYALAPERTPFGDENSYWFVQAKEIMNVLPSARQYTMWISYSYSLGVPFVSAMPALMTLSHIDRVLFFMPFIVVVIFVLTLWEGRRLRWGFLFLVAAFLFLIRHLWIQQLLFKLIYGEGLSAAFCLAAVHQLNCWHNNKDIKFFEIGIVSFAIGCMIFTKSPLSYVYITFLIPLLFIRYFSIKKRLFSTILFFLPLAIFRLFMAQLDGSFLVFSVNKYFQWDWKVLMEIGKYIFLSYEWPLIFYFLSFAAIVSGIRGRRLYLMIPVIVIPISVLVFYATVFSSNNFEDSARYLLHMLPSWYYLGAVGAFLLWERFFRKKELKVL